MLKMLFTDEYGEMFPESVWKLVQLNLNRVDKTGNAVFYGYQNANSVGKRVIAGYQYLITPELFDTYFATTDLDPEASNPYKQAYVMAKAIEDVCVGHTTRPRINEIGQMYDEDVPVLVSFFKDAEDA